MEHKPHDVMNEQVMFQSRGALPETVRMHLGFLLLGVMCLMASLLALLLRVVLPRALSKRTGLPTGGLYQQHAASCHGASVGD